MRFMTFNIQHALDYRNGVIDLGLFADTVRVNRADVCGLNEVRSDGEHAKGYTDQTAAIGDALGFHRFFGEATRVEGDNPYGNAIVSRFPFKEVRVVPIPDPLIKDENAYYETRCAIYSVIDTPAGDIACIVCHMGLAKSEARNAVEILCGLIDETTLPLVVMGDFNNTPDSDILRPLFERLHDTAALFPAANKRTYPSFAPDIKIDYLLYRGLICTHAAVIDKVVSDHFPIVADFEFES